MRISEIYSSRQEINFHFEDTDIHGFCKQKAQKFIETLISGENIALGQIQFIFCTDDYLLEINKRYLDHHTYTDIITFDYTEELNSLSGDIFISFDRVKENAKKYQQCILTELHRVMAHGVLHLAGYKDKTPAQKQTMRQKEDYYLSLL
ncbi:MAG: rRNA maturation RNase YbeY [Bacteroidia bacterium]|nr:MAG: rRNA maturation RNase YbeY [Bacteroidia bacterium]